MAYLGIDAIGECDKDYDNGKGCTRDHKSIDNDFCIQVGYVSYEEIC
jgi:hypothetical protein